MHLTNYSVNKQNDKHFALSNDLHASFGSKRLMTNVFLHMEAEGIDTKALWRKIKLLVTKTVVSLVPEMILRYEHQFEGITGPSCFQVSKVLLSKVHYFKDLNEKMSFYLFWVGIR